MREIFEQTNKLKEDILCSNFEIKHFKKEMTEYYSNIICCEFLTEDQLRKYWKVVVNNVAIHIQAKLNQRIEIYNVYILFFCKDVSNEIINIIEQNKYSSRKIIIKQSMPKNLEEIEEIIEGRLFKLKFDDSKNKKVLIHEWVKDINKEFYDTITKTEEIDENILESILKTLKCK